MWEAIRANKRKSAVLVVIMAVLLVVLGFVIGAAWFGQEGALIGVMVATVIWVVMTLITLTQGDSILLAVSGARKIKKEDHPQLFNVVEEMQIAAGLDKMPDVYIIDDLSPNAFAAGRSPKKAAIAVTSGLLAKLNRDQLEGGIAHEMSHIVNRDVLFMTVIGIMVGSIAIISEVFLRSLWFGAGRGSRRSRSSSEGGQAQLILVIVAVVLAILAPVVAHIIYFACSRRREYLADANSAVLTRYPEGLASALEVISRDHAPSTSANKVTAPMYIANPQNKMSASGWGSTHPPIKERIKILRRMAGGTGVSFEGYQNAWRSVAGKAAGALPASALAGSSEKAIRKPSSEALESKDPREKMRAVGDVLLNTRNFLFLTCACGLRIKLPPEFKKDTVNCPRCHAKLAVPVAELAAAAALGGTVAAGVSRGKSKVKTAKPRTTERQTITVKGKGWQSFKCVCGATINISPGCKAPHVQCGKCGRTVDVKYT